MFRGIKKFLSLYRQENEDIREYFRLCISSINKDNLYMMRRVCMYVSIIYTFMMVLAVIVMPSFKFSYADWFIIPIMTIYFFINLYTRRPTTNLSTNAVGLICGAFYFSMCFTFILMDVVSYRGEPALWTPIALVIFPMLYIDRIYKYGIEELVVVILFLFLTYAYKEPQIFRRDAFTIWAAYFIANVTAHIMLEMRSREGLAMMELRRISSLDKLTKVLNKDALLHRIEGYYGQKSKDQACAMCVIDLDDFKHVNDNLGHNTGDLLLERVGQLLHDSFRSYDIIGRYGGDEFVVLMPDMTDVGILEMRCRALQMMLVDFTLGNGQPFTVSIGAIIDHSSHISTEIFRMADDALYMSKLAGKSRCTTWVVEDRDFSGKPVLVVFTKGDKAGTSKLYKEESQHFDIISARTDKEALSYISQYHNNISIIFLEMDAIDDFEMVLRYIKTREGFANIPVLAVASSEENGKRAKELGADEVLLENSPDALYKKTVHKLIGM